MRLYPVASAAGVDAVSFWDMSFAEIAAVIDGYNKRVTQELKTRAYMDYHLAYMIGGAFGGKIPDLYSIYPGLFEEEAKAAMLAKFKAHMIEYAEYNNRKRGEASDA